MKFPQIVYRLILNGLIFFTIFASILFPSPTNANTQNAVSRIDPDSIMPGFSKTSINAPSVPNAPGAIDAPPNITINDVTISEGDSGTTDAVFWVNLSETYTQTVTVDYATQDGTAISPDDYTDTSGTLTFEAEQDVTMPITVTIQGDNIDEINETFTINLTNAVNGILEDATGLGTIIDDDGAEISVSPLSLTTSETGTSGEFSLVLSIQPTDNVHITLIVTDPTEGVLSREAFPFNSQNWDEPQVITVTGLDDTEFDGDVTYAIQIQAESKDSRYDNIPTDDVIVTNLDDESPILVSPLELTTSEFEDTDTFTVWMTSAPTATVTIALSSSDPGEGTVSTDSLSFTIENWATPQQVTVTGVNDDIDDGDQPYTIVTGAAVSTDPSYGGVDVPDVSVTNLDNDTAGISVFPLNLVTSETGMTNTFTVTMISQPTAVVTIDLSSSNTNEGTVLPVALTFTEATWNLPQTVTVTGVDDDVADGDIPYTIITDPAVSDDPNYHLIDPEDVSVTNVDDEWSIVVSPLELTTSEFGDTDTFFVSLTIAPIATVTIDISSSNLEEGTVSTNLLSFTTENWATPQQVTVTGVDDDTDDGDQTYTIFTGAAVSADPNYSGLEVTNVMVTNMDDDQAGFIVLPTSGLTTSEDGDADTFTIRLTSQPRETVTISLSSSDISEGMVSPGSLIFNQFNWTQPQSVIVAGVDDDLVDGDIGYAIVTAPTVSADPVYDGLNPPNVSATNQDDDETVDTEVPTVGWLSPVGNGGQMILTNAPEDQIVHLEANASDNVAIDHVRFRRWDAYQMAWVYIANVYNQPYQTDMDTSVLRCGFNQINVEAYDTSGNNTVDDKSGAYIWLIRYCYVYMPSVNK